MKSSFSRNKKSDAQKAKALNKSMLKFYNEIKKQYNFGNRFVMNLSCLLKVGFVINGKNKNIYKLLKKSSMAKTCLCVI